MLLSVSMVLNFKRFKFDTYGETICSIFSIFLCIISVCFPVFVYWFYTKNFSRLKEAKFRQQYGTLLSEFRLKHKSEIALPVWNLVRKLIIAVISVFMNVHPVLQLAVLNFATFVQLIIIGFVEPYKFRKDFYLMVTNEAFVLVSLNIMYTFSEFLPTPDGRDEMGIALICTTVLNVLILLGPLIVETLIPIIK